MRHNLIACCFLFVLAAGFCIKSLSLGIGSLRNPGAGFVPFGSATLLACLSIVIFLKGLGEKKSDLQFGKGWKKGAWVLGSLLFYYFFLEKLGFPITAFVIIFSLLSLHNRKWVECLSGCSFHGVLELCHFRIMARSEAAQRYFRDLTGERSWMCFSMSFSDFRFACNPQIFFIALSVSSSGP